MAISRRWALRVGLPAAALAVGGLVIGLCGLRVSHAGGEPDPDREIEQAGHGLRDPGDPGWQGRGHPDRRPDRLGRGGWPRGDPGGRKPVVNSKLATIQPQLSRLLPHHVFKLLDAQSAQLVAGESVECKLGHGYTAETTLVRPIDENGKVQLRCELSLDRELQFSATVRTPLNQLFFCERPFLTDGSKLLIGVGAR